jgi:hypothetical protein
MGRLFFWAAAGVHGGARECVSPSRSGEAGPEAGFTSLPLNRRELTHRTGACWSRRLSPGNVTNDASFGQWGSTPACIDLSPPRHRLGLRAGAPYPAAAGARRCLIRTASIRFWRTDSTRIE